MLFSLSACDHREIPVFNEQRYIHFSADTTEKSVVSFAAMPGVTEYEIGIPVTMIGRAQDADLPYAVRVVTEGDNATTLSQQAYELPGNPVFRSNRYEDTLYIKLFRLPELKDTEFMLTLEMVSNGNYIANFPLYARSNIMVGDKLVQPSWWDDVITNSYLGPYSDIKYLAFVEATDMSDLTGVSNLDVGTYVRVFVYWLREKDSAGQTVHEADGVTKVLSTITYANV